ncbi:MAG: thermonuclease family protein [Beijerinckiaceae bacterium]
MFAVAMACWLATLSPPMRSDGQTAAASALSRPVMADAAASDEGIAVASHPAAFPVAHLRGPLPAVVTRIIDGDTVEARVQIWLGQDVLTRVRLRDIDAPEINGACGAERDQALAARSRLAALAGQQPVWLRDIGRDKFFGRVVARLGDGDGRDFGEQLITEGLARTYQGGRRAGWCRWGN